MNVELVLVVAMMTMLLILRVTQIARTRVAEAQVHRHARISRRTRI